jgi:hypothetical protein
MTKREFVKKITGGKKDLLHEFTVILKKEKIAYCVIGGLAVNAYAEPVVSLDLDAVVIVSGIKTLLAIIKRKYKVKKYANSINISSPFSDLRIQIQTDPRYQDFIPRAAYKNVLGYRLSVAALEDVFQGKIWAALDESRRPSKRQKDLADILRLAETNRRLISLIPNSLKKKLSL